jgi:two-component system, chemotaxis family, chemotaxis protein CheY
MENKGLVVAVVDDDKIFQFTASKTITATGLAKKVLQFENGEDALAYLKDNYNDAERLPDYIFLDINMPFMDGWMFLDDYSALKGLAKSITIFMLSSSIDPRDVARATNNEHVAEYVVKPVTKEKFQGLLERAA